MGKEHRHCVRSDPTQRREGDADGDLAHPHAITDFDTWTAAFERFRRCAASTQRCPGSPCPEPPVNDPNTWLIDLDFDSAEEAEAFLRFLNAKVWQVPENSPALVGTPDTIILQLALTDEATGQTCARSR